MNSNHFRHATENLSAHHDARIERRCDRCEPPANVAKVRAVSVSDACRCDECRRPLWEGDHHWAVILPLPGPNSQLL